MLIRIFEGPVEVRQGVGSIKLEGLTSQFERVGVRPV
jgi:hypothetical protein